MKHTGLMITSDIPSENTGGGIVTKNEYEALSKLQECHRHKLICGKDLPPQSDPFSHDKYCAETVDVNDVLIAHFYAGTFTNTVRKLKFTGSKVSYTAAAHDIQESRQAHFDLGLSYDYPHMTDKALFDQYVGGYLESDLLICPSTYSKKVMESYGYKKNIVVIPHGVNKIEELPISDGFCVGYLGGAGPDKGLVYLIKSFADLKAPAARLRITSKGIFAYRQYIQNTVSTGDVILNTFVPDIKEFFKKINVYVQPSVTEGFGIEVLEAMAFGRPVICSDGAGACDLIKDGYNGYIVPRKNTVEIANRLDYLMRNPDKLKEMGKAALLTAEMYKWDMIQATYRKAWDDYLL